MRTKISSFSSLVFWCLSCMFCLAACIVLSISEILFVVYYYYYSCSTGDSDFSCSRCRNRLHTSICDACLLHRLNFVYHLTHASASPED
ncbi:unnamed protein product [Sphagnum jensenii]|uniref:Uncharacterized protein n=1 Tax=Sphagnum jensenii TaxID=128206 RepID=A0ABP1A303_9BRYO